MSHTAQTTDRPLRTLVLGGARSGKSAFAEQLVASEAVRYVATAVPDPADEDFAERIAAHQARRPATWTVVEGDAVAALADSAPATLIDDLGTWLTARIDARAAWESPRGTIAPDLDALVGAVAAYQDRLVIVSPEVGLGVIPSTRSGRLFRDELGSLNQRLAQVCDEVYLLVAGQPMRVKPDGAIASAAALSDAAEAISGVALAAGLSEPADQGRAQHAAAEALSATGRAASPDHTAPQADSGDSQTVSDPGTGKAAAVSGAEGVDVATGLAADADAAAVGAADATAALVNGSSAGGAGAVGAAAVGAEATAGGEDDSAPKLTKVLARPVEFGPVAGPDVAVRGLAEERQGQLTKPAGALGRLEALGNWVAACQGVCPPRQFERARVVVFAGDHGVARHGVSAYPSEVTAQMVANFRNGGAAVNVLARLADATVRVEDIAVDGETAAEISKFKVRRSSGSIDREDALSEEEVQAALAAGAAIADEEIDSGADLLIAGDMGIGNTTPATVLIASLTDTEPVIAVGRGTGVDDAGWIRKTAAIRDAMWRARPVLREPVALLRKVSGADLAAMTGFLAQAATRRTPVILDGVVVTAAALVADQLAPGARAWWVAGHRSSEPSHKIALERLQLEPLVDMNMRLGEGSGALTALPVLRAAVATLADMATFAEAGVSTADATEPASA
ncbi:nicotinate-nucleotide--dimethylbenzimidazole phosphoribosyltransferase [Nocardia huaxiensis]|uniref:Nicotinate-nucleotide--dimethylbenzimidazole phosphoribosyltransferase n=1 Tax=Nocardia huaxiensis TaxID=2755382 RepID=A0A7D6VI97_9NOCA|nr:nicotinate-nucleotide--dimethylbenzimidazole phosphoribosyltransferase [Nocardia huaxiensis]QLY33515.1 nicotinate-nucleotide--dimethylbenzimidazole phosphoribosyltransferase [Nocardia huaxiensis]